MNRLPLVFLVWIQLLCLGLLFLLVSNEQHIYLFGQIQSSQTGGQRLSDSIPYKVSEYFVATAKKCSAVLLHNLSEYLNIERSSKWSQ